MTDQSQSPELPDEQQAGDAPAALGPDAPTVAHPVIEPASDPPPPEPPAAWTPLDSASDVPAAANATPVLETPGSSIADRPEIAVGAAFAGGFVLALIFKRLAR